MGEILEFPSQQAQGLAFLERQLAALLESKGADEQLIAFAREELTRIYSRISESEQYPFRLQLPDHLSAQERDSMQRQVQEGLDGIRGENHRLLIELVAELLLTQVRLFQCERTP